MNEDRNFQKPLWLMICILIILLLIAYFIPAYDQGGWKIRKLELFTDLSKAVPDNQKITLAKIMGIPTQARVGKTTPQAEAAKPFVDPALVPFFEALKNCEQNGSQVRIAYFGDSIIEGDLITQSLRKNLQSRFGGSGVGYVPITSIVANFRTTIRHSYSPEWSTFSLMNPNPRHYPIGMSGYVSMPLWEKVQFKITPASDSSGSTPIPVDTVKTYSSPYCWVRYRGSPVSNPDPLLHQIRLFYSNAPAGYTISTILGKQPKQFFSLQPGSELKSLTLNDNTPVENIEMVFPKSNRLCTYGVSFDSQKGIYVDNYALRGYSGMYFTNIPKNVLSGFQQQMHYNLIVLQYGTNVSQPGTRNYSYYRNGMENSIRYLQQVFPGVPILLISIGDKSVKVGTEYQTSPDIPYLVKAQESIAKDTHIGFWNLYENMGGYNSMVDYVNSVPPLAQRDYTHFNSYGTNKIAGMLTQFLMQQYENIKR
jgi:hypothetical protein